VFDLKDSKDYLYYKVSWTLGRYYWEKECRKTKANIHATCV